jgi:hypothetical protein
MVRRAIELKDAVNAYLAQLHRSSDVFDKETFDNDYINDDEWDVLEIIRD